MLLTAYIFTNTLFISPPTAAGGFLFALVCDLGMMTGNSNEFISQNIVDNNNDKVSNKTL